MKISLPRRALASLVVVGVFACRNASAPVEKEPVADKLVADKPAADKPVADKPVAARPAVPADWPYPLDAAPVTAPNGMVASDSPEATLAGVEILESGGNAVDAAVAVMFALSVTHPEAGSLGGGGFAVVVTPAGQATALDFREVAPAASSPTMYLDASGSTGDRSITGSLAAGVPGVVRGMWELHRKHGSKPWADVVAPAIRLAEGGFALDPEAARRLAGEADRLARFPASAALYLPGGKPAPAGSVIKNPDLAAALRRIAADGDKGFYEGETARLIVAEMKRSGGIMTAEDLAGYRAVWREPVTTEIRGHRLYSMPPPSSGGIALVMLANLMGGYPLAEWHSAEHLHRLAEAMKRVFADRNQLLADPDFVKIDLATLGSRDYADRRRATIRDAATASKEIVAGLTVEENETTHFSVVDRDGMAVALTTTINLLYGSGVTVTGAGFLLNDEMDDFTTNPGKQNALGLVQGKRNAVQPGKRPLSSMSPTVVVGPDGKVVLVTGSRGGGRIITAVYQVLSNVLDYEMPVLAAVSAPRIHHQHTPDAIAFEPNGFSEEVRAELQRRGHQLRPLSEWQTVPTLMRTREGWAGTADPRRAGAARGH